MSKRTLTDAEAAIVRELLMAARAAAREGLRPGRFWLLSDLAHQLDALPPALLAKVQP
jgi:hypothetical protein